ncbi:hypothetical protein AVEN_155410-1 [Araneus ventricosus]|uniref:Uncharacterized protein n=1 Tax=Araneus ventricosus TaxID=182803 RepID=A0A4Y2SML9_ARAVE|nr:hypothetical protein AVEN_155410-1 [Araneus ventricosus]
MTESIRQSKTAEEDSLHYCQWSTSVAVSIHLGHRKIYLLLAQWMFTTYLHNDGGRKKWTLADFIYPSLFKDGFFLMDDLGEGDESSA